MRLMGNMSVSIFALLLMVRAAFTASDVAYPPHAATCSSVGGGVVAIYRGEARHDRGA